jgi:hypothetical protein
MRKRSLLLIAGITALALITWTCVSPFQSYPFQPEPSPNGYDDFIAAAQKYYPAESLIYDLTGSELEKFVMTNSQAFALFDRGLTCECQVPLGRLAGNDRRLVDDLSTLKTLWQANQARARYAAEEGRIKEATELYLRNWQFVQCAFRGGMLLHLMVHRTLAQATLHDLTNLISRLSLEDCRVILGQASQLQREPESFDTYLNRDNWYGKQFSLRRRISRYFDEVEYFGSLRPRRKFVQNSRVKDEARRKQLRSQVDEFLLWVATRADELTHGLTPDKTAELVPGFLTPANDSDAEKSLRDSSEKFFGDSP